MGLETLVGLGVALAVPVWLVVEEMLHWRTPASRTISRVSSAPSAPAVGAAARLGEAA
jgi:hypothetical protein